MKLTGIGIGIGFGMGLLVVACGGDGGASGRVTATVTLTDGTTFVLDEACDVDHSDNSWGFEGVDYGRPFGVVATWDRSVVTQAGTFSADDLADSVLVWIVREHPTDPSMTRLSTVNAGTITFAEVGYESGARITGTFDEVVMTRNDPDDMAMIRLDDGTFECFVP